MKERIASAGKFDVSSPEKLKLTQLWFASIITQPIDENSRIPEIAPSGMPIEQEAWDYIKPSPTLRPSQRIEIYSQQYWWRLLNSLQEVYPLVTRLFGYHDFNSTIAIPYLKKYPPNHWSLNMLGEWLPLWIEKDYGSSDKKLVLNAAEIDYAYHENFLAKQLKPLDLQDLPDPQDFAYLLTQTLYLQPSLLLFFHFDYDIFTYRMEFLKESPEYWIEHDFPPLNPTKTAYILFRNQSWMPIWSPISLAEASLLNFFRNGATIDEACQWLENQESEIFEEAEEKLNFWIQGWIIKKWLSLESMFLASSI